MNIGFDFGTIVNAVTWPLALVYIAYKLAPILEKHLIKIVSGLEDLRNAPEKISESLQKIEESRKKFDDISIIMKSLEDQIAKLTESLPPIEETIADISDRFAKETVEKAIIQAPKLENNSIAKEFIANEALTQFFGKWDEFANFASKLLRSNKLPDSKNELPSVAATLSHGKRAKPLTKEEAQIIQELYTNNRSFRRYKLSPPSEWYTPEVHVDIIGKIEKSKSALERIFSI